MLLCDYALDIMILILYYALDSDCEEEDDVDLSVVHRASIWKPEPRKRNLWLSRRGPAEVHNA